MAGRWLEVCAQVDAEAVEAVAALFHRYVYGGVAIEAGLAETPEVEAWTPEALDLRVSRLVVKGYLPLDAEAAEKYQRLCEGLWHLAQIWPVGPLTSRELDEDDWAHAWKEHFPVLRVGQRLVIRPSWRPYQPQPGDCVVELDPGMAFGTGLHPTTRLCLIALEQLVRPGSTVLDLGTGSGILALAAARLGAATVLALDIDPVAVAACQANVVRNALTDRITVCQGSLPLVPPRHFDLVVANLTTRVILDLAAAMVETLVPEGWLVASGVLEERAALVAGALTAAGLRLGGWLVQDQWVALIGRRAACTASSSPPAPSSTRR
jgi:ribosomal protein L11 methyltransferase